MKEILIGSRAAKHWFPDFREPHDTDIVTSYARKHCTETATEYYQALFKYIYPYCGELNRMYIPNHGMVPIASPELLYTIKLSHSQWDVHWIKTAKDLIFFQTKNVRYYPELLNKLYKLWTARHNKNRINLNKQNSDFFTKNVDRRYEHDFVHECIAYNSRPLFKSIKKDLSKAAVSKDLFNELDYKTKLQLCREEIYVIALERWIIPRDYKFNSDIAYRNAIKHLVCNLSKGWFSYFIMDNLSELIKPDIDYVTKFKESLNVTTV